VKFIGISDQQPDPQDRPRRRTAIFAWQLRWRLLIVVSIVVLLPSLLFQFVPGLRQWAGLDVKTTTQPLSEAEIANEDVETRLLPSNTLPQRSSHGPVVSGVQVSQEDSPPHTSPLQVAKRDRWSRLRDELGLPEKSRLQQVLKTARGGPMLTEDERPSWGSTLQKLDVRWRELGGEATAALAPLPESEKAEWSRVLEQLDATWNNDLRPLLAAAGSGQALTAPQQATLMELQRLLDDLALADIRDNTVIRSVEGDAWFRFFEQLQATSPSSLKAAAIGRIGFLQLFKQPQVYRGKLVTVRGDVRLGYRVAAQANHGGIEGYYVYWLKPAGGPNRPMVIYALETPPGFPALADKELGQPPTELDEPAEFTGYFFKNWAYPAQDNTRLAPLLLARAPEWQPVTAPQRSLPSGRAVVATVLASVVFAVALACFVYYKSQPPPRSATSFNSGSK
jgi:hypothetical protein